MDFRITGIHIDHAAIDRALAPALRAAMEELGTAEQAAIVKSLGAAAVASHLARGLKR